MGELHKTMREVGIEESPDFVDAPEDCLSSFSSIRTKTLQTLYGAVANNQQQSSNSPIDKSPKGSVDAPIRSLVDLINEHPSFATLSSCSGRIALFDPSSSSADGANGKGSGRWLLVSHEKLDPQHVLDVVRSASTSSSTTAAGDLENALTLRFEPLLLHVAACSLARGQQLLQRALSTGFRESGLIVTPQRVTVAIRSYSLALVVPLARQLLLPDDYLTALVEDANRRLQLNLQKLEKLYTTIECSLFPTMTMDQKILGTAAPLPNLNLVGHTALSTRDCADGDGLSDVLVFGGYGTGPHSQSRAPKRSDKIYRLHGHESRRNPNWFELSASTESFSLSTQIDGMDVKPVEWSAREGAASCWLRPTPPKSLFFVGIIFGGRKGPAHPLDDLLLFEYRAGVPSFCRFYSPTEILGIGPAARWGHSLTALRGKRRDDALAVLVGGRNASGVLEDSIYVLSQVSRKERGQSSHCLQWEQLYLPSAWFRRFHHSSVIINDALFVFGGLSQANNLLEPFNDDKNRVPTMAAFTVSEQPSILSVNCVDQVPRLFGLRACLADSTTTGHLERHGILLCGGVTAGAEREESETSPFLLVELSKGKDAWDVVSVEEMDTDLSNFQGSLVMVHHECVAASNTEGGGYEIACLGGGTSGFAFGHCFSSSCIFSFAEAATPIKNRNKTAAKPGAHLTSPAPVSLTVPHESYTATNRQATNVVYVKKCNAKTVKLQLEEASLLNKTYRMGPADDTTAGLSEAPYSFIAIPITNKGLSILDESARSGSFPASSWTTLVEGIGKQQLLWSSAVYARRKKEPQQ